MSAIKQKKCKAKGCDNKFTPFNTIQSWCSPTCGLAIAEAKKKEKYRKETTRLKREYYAKDRKHQIKLAKDACHAYIRYRDKDLPCIDCGTHQAAQWDAGHYKTRGGFPELQFNELNIHKQCSQCNKDGLRGMVLYRANLVKKLGARDMEWLERSHPPQNLTLDDIKGVTWWYKLKLKILQEAEGDDAGKSRSQRVAQFA